MENFNSIYSQIKLLYDLELRQEEFEEIGLIAWNFIGNKQRRLYRFTTEIDKINLTVELPCNCDEIEAVTYSFEEWKHTSNDTINGDYLSQYTEGYIEGRKLYNNPLYTSGKFAKYERVGDTLIFDRPYGCVTILYKGIVLDDEGLPYVNIKERNAIACYCAYTKKFKEGLSTNNGNIIQLSQVLEQRWLKLCDAARVPTSFSQNEMNQILDAKTNWNRKLFNKSYKPLK